MYAASCKDRPGSDHVEVLRLLLKDGRAAVDARDRDGCTALWVACCRGRTEMVLVLLVEGRADHTIAEYLGRTPMAIARERANDDCVRLLEWYEGELEKPFLLSKARAVVDEGECISRAAEKAGARTQAEVQAAREEAAPAYLQARVRNGGVLPVLEVVGQEVEGEEEEEEEEEERRAVCEYVVRGLKDDLLVEFLGWLRFR